MRRPKSSRWGPARKKATPCDEPGFLAAQLIAVAAETGWPEERILFMPLARLAQYQNSLLRRNGVWTNWSGVLDTGESLRENLKTLRMKWGRNHKGMSQPCDLNRLGLFPIDPRGPS